MTKIVQCVKLGKQAQGLEKAPLPGEFGKRILDQVSQEAWDGWMKHQTMLINENRLNLGDARARQYLLGQCKEYLFGEVAENT